MNRYYYYARPLLAALGIAIVTSPLPAQNATPAKPPTLLVPDPNSPGPAPAEGPFGGASLASPNNLPLRVIGNGIFELANIQLNKRNRTISFPAVVNMDRGPMEYFLVSSHGKVHESILRTDTVPHHIHVAMLLMDVKDGNASTNNPADLANQKPLQRASTISNPAKEKLKGDNVQIEVSWNDGKERKMLAEEMVFNLDKKNAMDKESWVYNGSITTAGAFGAQISGSLVSLITDPEALVNSIALGHENDDIWAVNTNTLPKVNTPVRVTFKLKSQTPAK